MSRSASEQEAVVVSLDHCLLEGTCSTPSAAAAKSHDEAQWGLDDAITGLARPLANGR